MLDASKICCIAAETLSAAESSLSETSDEPGDARFLRPHLISNLLFNSLLKIPVDVLREKERLED